MKGKSIIWASVWMITIWKQEEKTVFWASFLQPRHAGDGDENQSKEYSLLDICSLRTWFHVCNTFGWSSLEPLLYCSSLVWYLSRVLRSALELNMPFECDQIFFTTIQDTAFVYSLQRRRFLLKWVDPQQAKPEHVLKGPRFTKYRTVLDTWMPCEQNFDASAPSQHAQKPHILLPHMRHSSAPLEPNGVSSVIWVLSSMA